ncbi:MAG: hypothetical protein QOK28_2431 [Actinomycetota bacterium]|jgi:hypothetical protein
MRILGVLVSAVLLLVSAPGNAAASETTYRYVATQAGSFIEGPVARPSTPAGHIVLLGDFVFTATTNTFRLRIDDLAVRAGRSVGVYVNAEGMQAVFVCVADKTWQTFASRPGGFVSVTVSASWPDYRSACDAAGTTGTASVRI